MERRISATKFKAQCLSLFDRLDADGLLITKHGKPIAKLYPVQSSCRDLIGSLSGKIKIRGDIQSTGIRWDAES
ncbi:MAG: type II toxin-antitoxin system prevent-host-death family antitoxin [Acidobacteria bacterium]|nr:type II toxin-antitoxin system prevent-host-death family antitoxin [Acidobacteriota bacterium]